MTTRDRERSVAAMAIEIERVLAALDLPRVAREYWAQNEFVFLPEFLPPSTVALLLEDVERLRPRVHRNYIPRHKKGGSVSHFAIAEEGPAIMTLSRSPAFIDFLTRLMRARVMVCPPDDPHACALYFYTEPGDHIGYHYDTSYYRGARYTVLLGLVQRSRSRLLCRLPGDGPGREGIERQLETTPGSLVIFNGDKLHHAVSPSGPGEERIILTMEYVTDSGMGRWKRFVSNMKDAIAYFGPGTVMRGRRQGVTASGLRG